MRCLFCSTNPDTGEQGLKEVADTFVNATGELVYIDVAGEEIEVTPEHPFWVVGEGWTAA